MRAGLQSYMRAQAAHETGVIQLTEKGLVVRRRFKETGATEEFSKPIPTEKSVKATATPIDADTIVAFTKPKPLPETLQVADELLNRLEKNPPSSMVEAMSGKTEIKRMLAKLDAHPVQSVSLGERRAALAQKLEDLKAFDTSAQISESIIATHYKALRDKIAEVSKMPRKELLSASGKLFIDVITWPIWLPRKYLSPLLKMEGETAEATLKGLMENPNAVAKVAHYRGILDISNRINTLLKAGRLKESLQLYHAARILAHKEGMSFAMLDRSFIGYLHRALPASANYIGRVTDVLSPEKIREVPNFMEPDSFTIDYILSEQAKMVETMRLSQKHK